MRLRTLGALCALALAAPVALAQTNHAHPKMTTFSRLAGTNERPRTVPSTGSGALVGEVDDLTFSVSGSFEGLTADYQAAHLHEGSGAEAGPVLFALRADLAADRRSGTFSKANNTFTLTPAQVEALRTGQIYVNVHSAAFPDGEIRGQMGHVSINEVLASTAGTDTEFIELHGAAGVSLDGLTLLVFEGDRSSSGAGGIGVIDRVITLRGTIPSDGFWFAASPAAVAAYPGAGTPDLEIADNTFENGTETILLVTGFGGSVDQDCDLNDDGTLDVTPWVTILDGLALVDADITATPPDAAYYPVRVGPLGTNLPPGVYRRGNDAGPFVVLEFDVPAPTATPGTVNPEDGGTATGETPEGGLSLDVANPLRGAAQVRFATETPATLALYDVLGRHVVTLAAGASAGAHTAMLDASRLAPGAYVLRLTAGSRVLARAVTVVH